MQRRLLILCMLYLGLIAGSPGYSQPTVTISSEEADPTKKTSISVTISFDQKVLGFTADDLVVTNGSVASLEQPGYVIKTEIGGSQGNGNDQLKHPSGIARDAAGRIYIGDQSNHRVQVFNEDYTYLTTIGTGEQGDNNDQFDFPVGVAVNDNKLYVAEYGNHRVQVFDVNNDYAHLATIGTSGSWGSTNNHLNRPTGIFAGNGRIYVADRNNHRIQVFDADNSYAYLATIGTGSGGAANNQFQAPEGVAVGENGMVYVADYGNERVQIFDANNNYAYVQTIGITGNRGRSNEQLHSPANVALDADGLLYVCDASNNRIQIFDTNDGYAYKATIGPDFVNSGSGRLNFPRALVVDNDKHVYVVDQFNHRMRVVAEGFDYPATIAPTTDGLVTVTLPADAVTDESANGNTASEPFSFTYDATSPTVAISSSETGTTSLQAFAVSFTFSEKVSGFFANDITVLNASVTDLQSSDDITYTATLTPRASGIVSVEVRANVASDLAGNNNTEATPFTIEYTDVTPPTASISSEETDPTSSINIPVQISFSEVVTGFISDDLSITNGSVTTIDAGLDHVASLGTPGVSGEGNDQLKNPTDVAFGTDGKIYVSDGLNHRVQIYDAQRQYLATLGTTGSSGNGDNQFNFPCDVAVDTDGKIYVADRNNRRIQIFNADYSYASSIAVPEGSGMSVGPIKVAVADGKVYVLNVANLVQIFNTDGTSVTSFGSSGDGENQFNSPHGLAVDASGKIYVADNGNNRVQIYNNDYTYLATIGEGTRGSGENQFSGAWGVEVDSEGKIYVSDIGNQRVQIFNSDYTYRETLSAPSPFGLGMSPDGELYVTNYGGHEVMIFGEGLSYQAEITPAAEGLVSVSLPAGTVADLAGNASTEVASFSITYDATVPTVEISAEESSPTGVPAFPVSFTFSEEVSDFTLEDISVDNGTLDNLISEDNIQYTATLTPEKAGMVTVDIAAEVAQDLAGNQNTAATQFSIEFVDIIAPTASITTEEPDPTDASPILITISPSETITGLSSDDLQVTNGSVTSFTSPGFVYQQNIGSGAGNGNNQFRNPSGVAIAPDGKIYVADQNNNRIQVFNAEYSYLTTIGTGTTSGSGNDAFAGPYGITVAPDGKIYVADEDNHRIQVFDADRNYLATMGMGSSGSSNSQFYSPIGVAIAPDGKIYVSDQRNHRIQVFDADRNYLATIGTGTAGNSDNQFNMPTGVSVAPDGKIYVADRFNHRIQVFDADRNYLATIGTGIQGDGNDQFKHPYGVSVASDGKVYVADQANHRIQVFDRDRNYLATINNEFSSPVGVAISPDRKLYVVNLSNHRLQIFEPGTDYQAEITPDAEGEVSVEIAAGAFSDEAGIASTEAASFSIYYDTAVPTVAISSAESGFTDQSPFVVSIVFSEEMTGFEAGDISVTNGTAGNLQSSDNITFTADITPAGDGEVKVAVGAGVATDLGGRDNTAAEAFSVNYDVLPPTASITSSESDPTNVSPITITVSPSETITDFTSDDLQVTNGSVTSFTSPGFVYQQTIGTGTSGTGDNQFSFPAELSVASDGKIYVADQINHRIQVFNDDYSYHATIGTGTEGSDDNQFDQTSGVSVAPDGKVYVADLYNHRIQVFNADYTYHSTIGTTGTDGSGDNQFHFPVGVSVGPDGKVYVADEGNHRIQVFDSDHNYHATIGTSGSPGIGDNQFNIPTGVSVASDGKVYVADLGNHRIQVFNADYSYHATIGTTGGSDDNQFFFPIGVSVASDGKFYVADRNNHRVQVFNVDYSYHATIGTTGTQGIGDNQFNSPRGVSVDSDGKVYVADYSNHRIQVFAPSTDYQAEITPDAEGEVSVEIAAGAFSDEAGIASTEAASFSIYYDTAVPTVEISSAESGFTDQSPFAVSITFSEEMTGFEAGDISVTNGTAGNLQSSDNITFTADITPAGDGEVRVAVGAGVATDLGGRDNTAAEAFSVNYDVLPPTASITSAETDPTKANPIAITITPSETIIGFTSDDLQVTNGSVTSFSPPGFPYQQTIGTTGTSGTGDNQFSFPAELSVASDGKVYVADFNNHRIQVFNSDYSYHATIGTGTSGSGNDQFNNPTGVSVASDGKVYVADTDNHRIQVFNDDYSYHATIGTGTRGDGNDQFHQPRGVSVASDGKVYVADTDNHRIQVFNDDYSYHATIGTTGTQGSDDNQFNSPHGVSVASDGKVYVEDRANHRIQVFNDDYSYHATIGTGTAGSENDQLNQPHGVSVASDGKVYVADLSNHRIQVFNADYSYQATIGTGTEGSDDNQFNNPIGVSVASDGKVYVADNLNHRIQIFESLTDYQAEITPAAEGEVSVEIAAATFADLSGKDNVEAATFSITYDATSPTVSITSEEGELSNASPFTATFTFSEEVQDFTAEDISVTNGSTANLQSSDNISYTVEITPAGGGEVSVSLGAELAEDLAGNLSEASNTLRLTYDGTAPTVSITADEGGQTELKSFDIAFTFSEAVSGFSAEDVSLENATLSDLSSGDDKIFTATLTAMSGGTVSVSVAEGQAMDAAGNGNVASEAPLSIIFDQAPVITADQSFEISQISPEGSLLGRIAATDVTEGTTLQDWTMLSVTEGEATAEGIFTIDATTGEISVSQASGLGNASRDFVLTLTVSDGAKVSEPAELSISYRPVNQAPSFVKGEDISLLPGAADYRYENWASQVSAGPAGEAGQQLTFVLSNDQPDFFTSPPVISSNGELSFSLADNVSGTVTVTVQLQDDGGTANGGADSSEPVTFTITVSKIPQLITFAPLADKMVGQDPIVLAAEGGASGAPVTFSISTEPAEGVARLEGNRVIIDDVGEVTVTATQAGNDTYQEAEPVVRRFSITTNALFLPSAFTPNEDGFNDRFILRGGGGVASVEFTITDRNRNIVYQSSDWEAITSEGWDGKYQGKNQPIGIYIWRLKGSYRNGQPLEVGGRNSGIIRLIR